jgi:hypothetical protein
MRTHDCYMQTFAELARKDVETRAEIQTLKARIYDLENRKEA